MKNASKVVLKQLKHKTSSPCLHNTNKEDAEQKPFSMTCGFAKGFTLIELLVVVLIIGILSAVALPQYTKAVEKSRLATMIPLLRSLADAKRVYFMATGEHARTFDVLDVSLPSGAEIRDDTHYGQRAIYPTFYLLLDASSNEVAGVMELSDKSSLLYYIPTQENSHTHLCAGTIDKRAEALCKSLPGAVYANSYTGNSYYYLK
ncbi:type IV pilin protein [Candidatus Avelusimicrobium sp.]